MQLQWATREFKDLSSFELYDILKLRQEVFIVEQNCPYLDCDDKDFKSYHVAGRNDEQKLVAYARIVFPGVSYPEVSIGRVVTSPAARRTGQGRFLMEECLKQIEKYYGKVPIRIGAQRYLLKFYESYGFIPLEDYIEDGIPHTIMLRE